MDYHQPVLLKEVLENLNVQVGEWYIDATLGDGGHSLGILKKGGKVLGIDQDPQALIRAEIRFNEEGIDPENYRLVKDNFKDLKSLAENKIYRGIIFDLGVSSLQLDDKSRGFSFLGDGPLDMRMDPSLAVTALDLVNGFNKGELEEILLRFGEEYRAKKIAEEIVKRRTLKKIETTKELADIIEKVVKREGKIHPATKTFQALRIVINDELNVIKMGLEQAKEVVKGSILVISFHSLEDRIVKNIFKSWGTSDGPITPTLDEIKQNPRSRSAKLRVFKI